MTRLNLHLLGGFSLTAAETELRLPTRKAEALLAVLALPPGRAHRRDALTALLWGDRGEPQARHSLSQTLFAIRRALPETGPAPLVVDGETVALDPARVEVDVDRFERLAVRDTPEELAEAVALYRGELLEGLRLREEAFEEWLATERSRLRELALGALARLLERHAAAGATERAIQAALRLVALDPLQESVHRTLMRLYVAQGRPASALKQYELCARALRDELGVEPEAETRELCREIQRLRADRGGRPAGPPAPPRAPAPPPVVATGVLDPREGAPHGGGHGLPATAPVDVAAHAAAAELPADPIAAVRAGEGRLRAVPAAPRTLPALGRDAELRYLHRRLEEALAGRRRVVFVTGEAGLGKTTLVDAFLDEIDTDEAAPWIGHGQCVEHQGPGEAYMPVLEALGRMCRVPRGGRELVALLANRAPTWLVQMPWLLDAAGLEALQRRVLGVTGERMLREMVEAVEAITADTPLVLVLEDLHWSDPSTVDLLARLARRREPARLLVIGTYRPAEVRASGHSLHPVVQELRLRGHCEELPLGFLSQAAVEEYLAARFPGAPFPAELARLVHERTDGNPLFMGALADSWVAQGLLVEEEEGGRRWSLWAGLEELTAGVPDTLRQLIEQQLERLGPENREILEAASVAGREFSAAAVAAGAGRDEDEAEARYAALARQGRFLHPRGIAEWPDGTIASRYGFVHDLYQEVLYDGVPAGRRVRLHRRIGARLEAAYGPRARERAAELAVHFVRGRDSERAVRYLRLAAEQALQRSAHREAIGHLAAALEVLRNLPDDLGRAKRELTLQVMLAESLTATQGWSSREAERAYIRARELCRQLGEPPELSRVLYGLATLYEFRGEFTTSHALIEERLRLPATDSDDAEPFLESQELLACSLYHRGWFARALAEADRGLARYERERPRATGVVADMVVHLHAWAAMALWFLGHPDRAARRIRDIHEAAEMARGLGHAAGVAAAQAKGAVVHQLRRNAGATEEWATAALALATEQGFRYRAAVGLIFRGWALAVQGRGEDGVAQLREGLAALRETGAEMDRPYYLALLGEACGHAGRIGEGLDALAEGLAMVRGGRGGQPFFYEAELHRLTGALLLQRWGAAPKGADEAEASLRRALDVARRDNSPSLELRAASGLARLWRHGGRGGKRAESRRLLEGVYGRFAEGFDTPDLREAQALLDELGDERRKRSRRAASQAGGGASPAPS